MKITLAQINVTVGDLAGNLAKILGAWKEAAGRGSDLVVCPELAVTGYPPEDLLFRKAFIDENLRALRRIAAETRKKRAALVIGFVDRDKAGRLYNAVAAIHHGTVRAVYHKNELPNYGVFDEKRYFSPGNRPGYFSLNGVRIGLSVCEDIWQPTSPVYQRAFRGSCDLLLNLSASPYHMGKQSVRFGFIRKAARHAKVPVAYVNLVGGQDELVFDGGSVAVDARGQVLAEAPRFEERLLTFTLSPKHARHAAAKGLKPLKKEEEVYRALVMGTRDYVLKNGFKKALIGLSGGVDSALVARIAVDALGADNVIGVTMPSPYTSAETYRDAKRLAASLGMHCLDLKIHDVLLSYLGLFEEPFKGLPKNSTEENIQARIRGTILMALSNKFGHIVLTTGNKSELATGYCTLYGDMAGGFAVIKDVPKTLVYKLCRWRNARTPKNSIPESILRRAPTAELKENQKDQDTLPPYPALDRFLEHYVERDVPAAKIGGGMARIARMVDHNEYKRRQSPPGVKITPKAFGRDRRMPITNRFSS